MRMLYCPSVCMYGRNDSDKEAVEERGEEVVFCQGCSMLGPDMRLEGFTETTDEEISPEECERMMEEAVRQAKRAGKVVLFAGRPLDIREIAEKAKTVLLVWMPGTEDRLCFLTENDGWESEPGEFEVLIGSDSTTENRVVFTLTGD